MKTREQLDQEYADAIKALEAETALRAMIPPVDGIPIWLVYRTTVDNPKISYQVKELADVVRIAETLKAFSPSVVASAGNEYQAVSFRFQALVDGKSLEIDVQSVGSSGNFGIWVRCQRQELFGKSIVKPGSWQVPRELEGVDVTGGGWGGTDSVRYVFTWPTMDAFRAWIDPIVAKRAEQARQSRIRAREDYMRRRNVAELINIATFVRDTLARPEVVAALPTPEGGWTLDAIRAAGYTAIHDAVAKTTPGVMSVGLHAFANGLYFLSKDTDTYDHAVDYRDDLRKVYSELAAGLPIVGTADTHDFRDQGNPDEKRDIGSASDWANKQERGHHGW